MNLKSLTDSELHNSLKNKAAGERAILVDVVSHIHEADRRRLYIQYNYPSLFEYLVGEMKYQGGSAQRRIDAARLLGAVPSIRHDIESGALGLMQLSVVSQGIKQKIKEGGPISNLIENKRELLELVKGQSLPEAQKAIARKLDIEIKSQEKKVVQKDGSVRVEMTLTPEQAEKFRKVRDLISHTHPGATIADVFAIGLDELIKRKDHTLKGNRVKSFAKSKAVRRKVNEAAASAQNISTTTVEVSAQSRPYERKTIPANVKRLVFQKFQQCQWSDRGKICGSTFQSQIDHIVPVRSGGRNEPENLQVLCSRYNKIKYEKEIGQLQNF